MTEFKLDANIFVNENTYESHEFIGAVGKIVELPSTENPTYLVELDEKQFLNVFGNKQYNFYPNELTLV